MKAKVLGVVLGVLAVAGALALFLLPGSESAEAQVVINGEHYKCYPIIQLETPFNPVLVTLRDQFAFTNAWVLRPIELCNPVDKNNEGWINPQRHLVCYEITEPLQPNRRVKTSNQFGDLRFVVKDARKLCVPSTKQLLPNETGEDPVDPDVTVP